MLKLLLVGLGGFFGSVLRYLVSGWVQGFAPGLTFPWGTLSVNLAGCFLLGIAAGWMEVRGMLAPETRLLVVVGFLGGFTTFSTFGLECFGLLQEQAYGRLTGTLLGSVGGGVLAVALGVALARHLG